MVCRCLRRHCTVPGQDRGAKFNVQSTVSTEVPSLYITGKLRTLCITRRDLGLVCGHQMGEAELSKRAQGKPKREVLREGAGLEVTPAEMPG